MTLDTPITIDLRKYGLDDGEVVMGAPGSRKILMYKNRMAKLVTRVDSNNQIMADISSLEDAHLESLVLYTRSAPFNTVNGLIDLLDQIDERLGPGRGMALIQEMDRAKNPSRTGIHPLCPNLRKRSQRIWDESLRESCRER